MKYYASKNASFDDEKANVFGQELAKIQKGNGGLLTPEMIVKHARSPKNPLHEQFQWDDTVAAENYRKSQARNLIGKVVVRVRKREVRAFHSVVVHTGNTPEDAVPVRVYIDHASVDKEPDLRDQMLKDALRSLRHFRTKYAVLEEVTSQIELAIETLSSELKEVAG